MTFMLLDLQFTLIVLQSQNLEDHRSITREGSSVQRAQSQRCPQPSSSAKCSSGRKPSARSVGSGPAQNFASVPPLAIALLVCGTRGDVQVRSSLSEPYVLSSIATSTN